MSGIAGVVRFDGAPVASGLVERMTAAMAYRGPDGIRHRVAGGAALGHCRLGTTPEALEEAQPLASEERGLVVVLDGRVDNREDLMAALERRGPPPRDASDAGLVLGAYAAWGEDCLSRVDGDFAFVVWDEVRRTAFCARDRMGNRPFHYHWQGGVLSFASDLCALLALPWVRTEPNEGFLAEALADEWRSRDETIWLGVRRLVAAHRMVVGAGGLRLDRYWEPDLRSARPLARESDLLEEYRETLFEEVRRRARSHAPVAFEVSGGLDSSALFAVAARLQESGRLPAGGLRGYTLLVPGDDPANDLPYARAVGRFTGRPLREVPASRPPLRWYAERAASLRDFPGYLNGAMFLELKRCALRDGCRIVVTGEGGDQWLGGERTYYAEALRAGRWGLFLSLFSADAGSRGARAALSWAVRQGVFPLLPASVRGVLRRAARWKRGVGTRGAPCPWLTPRLNRLLQERRAQAADGSPARVSRAGQARQLEVLADAFGDHVLEVNERLNATLGLEGRDPLLSPAVVQLAFSLPEWMRRRGERNKYLHVAALEGFLPRVVLERRDKADFGSVARPQLEALETFLTRDLPGALGEWLDPDGLARLFRDLRSDPRAGWPIWTLSGILGYGLLLGPGAGSDRPDGVP